MYRYFNFLLMGNAFYSISAFFPKKLRRRLASTLLRMKCSNHGMFIVYFHKNDLQNSLYQMLFQSFLSELGVDRQGALRGRCGGAGVCVEPRWQPEENDRGRARPSTGAPRTAVCHLRWAPFVWHARGMETSGFNPFALLPGVNVSRDAPERRCLWGTR